MPEEIIKKILLSLNTSKVTGMDQAPATFPKDCAKLLILLFRNIINSSIKRSSFAEECKIAKLKPILKKDASTDPKNYQPILILLLV